MYLIFTRFESVHHVNDISPSDSFPHEMQHVESYYVSTYLIIQGLVRQGIHIVLIPFLDTECRFRPQHMLLDSQD